MNELIFEKMDRRIRKRKLYLDPDLSLQKAAKLAGTNRTYMSRAVCSHFGNFRHYVNTIRVENLLCDFYGDGCDEHLFEDADEFAQEYGFKTKRSMDRIVQNHTGQSYAKIKRCRKREEERQMKEAMEDVRAAARKRKLAGKDFPY